MIKYTGWTIFDPIASLFIALLIMASVIPLVIDCGRVLCLDVGADVERDIKTALTEVRTRLLFAGLRTCFGRVADMQISNVPGLASFSAPRIWPRNEGDFVCSLHIQLALSESAYGRDSITGDLKRHTHGQPIYANADRVVKQVKKVLRNRVPGLSEIVVQVEGSEEGVFCDCMTGGG
jgi:zinc transporter 5/7